MMPLGVGEMKMEALEQRAALEGVKRMLEAALEKLFQI